MPALFCKSRVPLTRFSYPGKAQHEAHFPAKQPEAPAYPRIQGAHGHTRRKKGPERPEGERPKARGCLTSQPENFSRRRRLLRSPDFDQTMKRFDWRGERRAVRLLVRRNEERGARLGIVTPKRFVRLASQRNAIKRIVRETYRHAWQELPAVDMVVMIGPGCERKSLADSLRSLFVDLKLKKPDWFA